jgi:predicted ribosome quality control (RQC) complex YloA/Tae2 family protein
VKARPAYRCSRHPLRLPLRRAFTGPAVGNAGPAASAVSPDPPKVNLKSLKKDMDRVHKKTFNAIVQLNKRAAATSSENNVEAVEKINNLQLKMVDINVMTEILATEKLALSPEQLATCMALAEKLGVPLVTTTERKTTSSINIDTSSKKKEIPTRRKPYLTYTSSDSIKIRVGRSAADNDVLTISPEHRDDDDWWLHVSGSAGSHVVIRSHDDELPRKYPNTLREAACLAAMNSKSTKSKASVTYTRCKFVSKKKGDPDGMVRLGLLGMNTDTMSIGLGAISKIESVLKTKEY